TVNQPDTLIATISSTDNDCYGENQGTANISASGGTNPYSYNWSTGATTQFITNLTAGIYYASVTDIQGCIYFDSVEIIQPAELIISDTTIVPANCGASDGSISVTVTGGTTPFTYLWNDGQTESIADSLSADFYLVTVTDANNCSIVSNFMVPNATAGIPSITGTIHNRCYGMADGQAEVVISGGTPPYTYLWTEGQTESIADSLPAGDYSVTITDNVGCISTASVQIFENSEISATFNNVNDITCFGLADGSASVTVTGGTQPYSYLWNNGDTSDSLSALSAGLYYVTVTDDSLCILIDSIMINQPAILTAYISDSSNILCYGDNNGNVTVASVGGTIPHNYQWDDVSSATTATVLGLAANEYYHVTVSDPNGCTVVDSVILSQPDSLVIDTNITSSVCGSFTGAIELVPSGGTLPYIYNWIGYPSNTDSILDSISSGSYTVSVSDNNGCDVVLVVDVPDIGAGTPSVLSIAHIDCYGDSSGSITVGMTGGAPPFSYLWSDGQTTMTASNLSADLYSVTINDASGCIALLSNITVSENPQIIISFINHSYVSCYGSSDGQVTADASGGLGGYSYQWDDPLNTTDSILTGISSGLYHITVTDIINCLQTDSIIIAQPVSLVSSISNIFNISCYGGNDGFAEVSVNGGILPYDYLWDNQSFSTTQTATTLEADIYYHVTITDLNGCIKVDSVMLTQPSEIIIDTNIIAANCGASDGIIEITPSGGIAPYSYNWLGFPFNTDSILENIPAGNYSVEITDSLGCDKLFTISLPNQGAGTASVSNIVHNTCFGDSSGSISVSVLNGTPPYIYSWSDGQNDSIATGLAAGLYSVTIIDSLGCNTYIQDIEIEDGSQIIVSIDSLIEVTCTGLSDGQIYISVTGGTSPYGCLWDDPGFSTDSLVTNLAAGIYHIAVTDANGCTTIDTIQIDEPLPVNAEITDSMNVSCYGDNDGFALVTASGGTPAYSYEWDNATSSITQTVLNLLAGIYYHVTVTDFHGCTGIDSVILTEPLQIQIDTTIIAANCGASDGIIEVSPSEGVAPYSYNWPGYPLNTDSILESIPTGTYSVEITDANGCDELFSILVPNQGAGTPSVNIVDNNCYGDTTGSINVSIAGGNPPYNYTWSNGQNDSTAVNLGAGLYSVTIIDSLGCTTLIPNIPVDEGTSIIITFDDITDVSCNGLSDGSATAEANGGMSPYSYQWDDTGMSVDSTVNNLAAGVYHVTITDSNGCTATDTVIITEPLPIITTITDSTNITCYNGNDGYAFVSVSGGSGIYTYQWDNTSSSTTPSVINLVAGVYYHVTVSDSEGCIKTDSVILSQPLQIQIDTTVTAASCGASDGIIELIPSGGVSPYIYNWLGYPLNTDSILENIPWGLYTVEITDANGCDSLFSVFVPDEGAGIVSVSNIVHNSCYEDSTGSITVSIVGGVPPYIYDWSDGQDSITAVNLGAGVYNVIVTDDNGCTSFLNGITIQQPLSPLNIVFNITDINCYGDTSGSVDAQVSGGTSPYGYLWNDAGASITSGISNLAAGWFTVIVTDGNQCVLADSVEVTEPAPIIVSITDSLNIACYGDNNGYVTISVTGGTPIPVVSYVYAWDNASSSNSVTATGLQGGIYYHITIQDLYCIVIDSIILTQPDTALSYTSSTTPANCGLSDGSATVTPSGGTAPYQWNWDSGAGNATTETVDSLGSGMYSVTITDTNECSVIGNVAIESSSTVILTITGINDVSCYGYSDGSATVSLTGGFPPYSYLWSDGDTTATDSGMVAAIFYITTSDINGCTAIDSVEIGQPEELTLSLYSTDALCNGAATGYTFVTPTGGTGSYYYLWSNGVIVQEADSLPAGIYTITVTDDNNCMAIDTVTISEPLSELNAIVTTGQVSCYGGSNGTATVITTGGTPMYSYHWSDPAGQTTATATGLIANDNYSVTVTDNHNCTVFVDFSITEPVILSFNLSEIVVTTPSCVYGEDGGIDLSVQGGISPYSYIWSTGATTEDISDIISGNYSVSINDVNQCQIDTTINVPVNESGCLLIPTAFSPNDDGTNETWKIENIGLYSHVDIQIFNRWGNKVFSFVGTGAEYEDLENQFKGIGLLDTQLPHGAYLYILLVQFNENSQELIFTGSVAIIR
ncbi:MAG: gliding motility-associated C-terminal domain-containing protein, partial [Bacteroidia bacterium]|nr:gliding motility-associated C-terminal domain-containing protein [Bacteroidia bacterium]